MQVLFRLPQVSHAHECSCVTGNFRRFTYLCNFGICVFMCFSVWMYVPLCLWVYMSAHVQGSRDAWVFLSGTLPPFLLKDSFPELGACVFSARLKASKPQRFSIPFLSWSWAQACMMSGLLCGCWDLISGPDDREQMLLATESSLQPLNKYVF